MSDAAPSAVALAPMRDGRESPSRRALRRLLKRKGAVIGLVIIASYCELEPPCDFCLRRGTL
jgi:peptide/nickel transport system permease protein